MSRRTFEMHHYQAVLTQMRSGMSDRQIARLGLMGRGKCGELRVVAQAQGWLSGPLPEARELHEKPSPAATVSVASAVERYRDRVTAWAEEIARLSEEIRKQTAEFNKRPKRKFISVSTKEPEYLEYLEIWVRRIQLIGNENFPEEARRLNLHGVVVLTVSIGRDGQLLESEIISSSGSEVLDKAAIAIARFALGLRFNPTPELSLRSNRPYGRRGLMRC